MSYYGMLHVAYCIANINQASPACRVNVYMLGRPGHPRLAMAWPRKVYEEKPLSGIKGTGGGRESMVLLRGRILIRSLVTKLDVFGSVRPIAVDRKGG